MTDSIKKSLKEHSNLTKCYYKNGQEKNHHGKLLKKSADCTKDIFEAKNNYILKVTTKRQYPKTSTKTYWAILSRHFTIKKIPALPPLLENGKFVSDFVKKQIFLITLLHQYVRQ